MEVKVLKKSSNYVELLLSGERHTFPSLLKERLLDDASVTFASYKLEHPMDKDSVLVVRTKGKPAKKALEDACKKVEADLKTFDSNVKKAVK